MILNVSHLRLAVALSFLTGFAVDQVTKATALAYLTQGSPIAVIPGFNLSLGFNEGASFGMLSGIMAGNPLAMAAMTGIITLGLAVLALRSRNLWEAMGFALAVGGSAGNILDRLRRGAVTDFLDVYWRDWHWPTFNVADIAITVGAVLILVASLPLRRRKEPSLDPS